MLSSTFTSLYEALYVNSPFSSFIFSTSTFVISHPVAPQAFSIYNTPFTLANFFERTFFKASPVNISPYFSSTVSYFSVVFIYSIPLISFISCGFAILYSFPPYVYFLISFQVI